MVFPENQNPEKDRTYSIQFNRLLHVEWDKCHYVSKAYKMYDFCEFLLEVRRHNPLNKICLILDNFATHKAKRVHEKAIDLNIKLIFLPPYCPDLNPIEFIWKSLKRFISISAFENAFELISNIDPQFKILAVNLSFACRWIEKFLVNKLNLLG